MGKALICGMARTTRANGYAAPACNIVTQPTEARSAVTCRLPGRFSNLGVSIDAIGTGRSYQFRKNGANGNQLVSPTNTTAGFYADATNVDVLAAGDTFDVAFAATGATIVYGLRTVFEADNDHGTFFVATDNDSSLANNFFIAPCGLVITSGSSTESDAAAKARSAGTLANFQLFVAANTSPTDITIVTRINGSNGNCSITVPAGSTGLFEDTAHSDAISGGDTFCLKLTGYSSGHFGLYLLALSFSSTTPKNDLFCGFSNTRPASATTHYIPITGRMSSAAGTLTEAQMRHGFPGRCSNLRVNVSSNTYSADATVRLVKNGVDGNQVVTITAGANGWFEDALNTDTFLSDDDIAISIVGGTSGSMRAEIYGLTEIPDIGVYAIQMDYGMMPTRPRVIAY